MEPQKTVYSLLLELLPGFEAKLRIIENAAIKSGHLQHPVNLHLLFWYVCCLTPLDFIKGVKIEQPVLTGVRSFGANYAYDPEVDALVNLNDPADLEKIYADFADRPFLNVIKSLAKYRFFWDQITRISFDRYTAKISFANGDRLFFSGDRPAGAWVPLIIIDGCELEILRKFLTHK